MALAPARVVVTATAAAGDTVEAGHRVRGLAGVLAPVHVTHAGAVQAGVAIATAVRAQEAAAHGVNTDSAVSDGGGNAAFKALEKERLRALLFEWIGIELERSPFKTIGTEEEREIALGRLTLKGRIDRLDELPSGEKIVIDYKTGSAGPKEWLTERPADPQMMLYCMAEKFGAVAFARLKRGEAAFSGIAREEGMLPGIKPFGRDLYSRKAACDDWDALMALWKKTVEALTKGFLDGEASVDPRDFGREDSACKYCDQTLFCRVFDGSPSLSESNRLD